VFGGIYAAGTMGWGTLQMLGYGIVLSCAAVVGGLLAPRLDVASKLAAATIPVGQITAARFLVQGALMLPVALVMRLAWAVSPKMAGLILLRAIFLILSTYCFVAAIRVMPIADALAIAFVEPFILPLLGRLLFADEVGPRRIAASLVGFCGAILVIQPSLAMKWTNPVMAVVRARRRALNIPLAALPV
jgi:drug/metabolite transporter (DMT)-like permease